MPDAVERVGEQFGDYRLVRLLGAGGFAQVYLGQHVRNGTPAAVKVLQTQLSRSEDLKAFLNEARTFRLVHPHIVRLLDFGIGVHDVPYLVMDYAPYGTLRDRHPRGTRVPLQTILSYVMPIASALQYAHDQHLVHRDIKPENMLIGPEQQIWLSDFGIVATAHSSRSMQTEHVVGTWSYMAPEQIQGQPRPASDQYALGIVVYEWLCGIKPFTGTITEIIVQQMQKVPTPLRTYLPDLPPGIEEVILIALAKEPHNRFSSVQEFAGALQRACQFSASLPTIPHQQASNYAPQDIVPQPMPTTPVQQAAVDKARYTHYGHTEATPNAVDKRGRPTSRRAVVGGLAGLVVAAGATSYFFWRTQAHGALQSVVTPMLHSTPATTPEPSPTPTPVPIGTPVFTYHRHTNGIPSVRWSPQDGRLVSAGQDSTAQVWGAQDGGNFVIYTGHTAPVNEAAWSPNGKYIASASSDKTVQVWESASGQHVYTYYGHYASQLGFVTTVVWSPDGTRIASGGNDSTAQVWDATTGRKVFIYKGHKSFVNKLAWSPDGTRIASASSDTTVQIWNAADGGNTIIYTGHKGSVRMVAWSPDGKRIASVSDDQTVQVWDAQDGGNVFIYTGHRASVSAATWSPDSKRIASSSDDKTVQVWDAQGGSNVFTYTGHKGGVLFVAWSHNGRYVASSGDVHDTTVQIWYA